MGAPSEDAADPSAQDPQVAAVEARRAEGLSVTEACRAADISPSTYYRRRRRGPCEAPLASLADLSAAAPPVEAPIVPETGWPFTDDTPRAPFFWDQVFAEELSDSFVRRTFGARRALGDRGALSALFSAPPAPPPILRGLVRRTRPIAFAARSLLGVAALGLLVGLAGMVVSEAAAPAAWLGPADVARLSPDASAP